MYKIVKRAVEFLFSFIGLIILFPLFLIIIIILKVTGEREVFYLQERIGKNNKTFSIYKFATMLKDSVNIGNKGLTVRNDPRITKFGKILRITKINELPQIINVLKGDMSLVGPRPLLQRSFQNYTTEVQTIIYKNKPGITGLGSLVFRDEELLVTKYKELGNDPIVYYRTYIFPYKGELEKWYFENSSFSVDFKILFLTFWSILYPKSQLVYRAFKNLPLKPDSLTLSGIEKL